MLGYFYSQNSLMQNQQCMEMRKSISRPQMIQKNTNKPSNLHNRKQLRDVSFQGRAQDTGIVASDLNVNHVTGMEKSSKHQKHVMGSKKKKKVNWQVIYSANFIGPPPSVSPSPMTTTCARPGKPCRPVPKSHDKALVIASTPAKLWF